MSIQFRSHTDIDKDVAVAVCGNCNREQAVADIDADDGYTPSRNETEVNDFLSLIGWFVDGEGPQRTTTCPFCIVDDTHISEFQKLRKFGAAFAKLRSDFCISLSDLALKLKTSTRSLAEVELGVVSFAVDDMILECSCNVTFVHTKEEQERWQKLFGDMYSPPKKCPKCRSEKKVKSG